MELIKIQESNLLLLWYIFSMAQLFTIRITEEYLYAKKKLIGMSSENKKNAHL